MALSVIRKAPLAVMLMLGCAPAQAGWFSSDPAAKVEDKPAVQQPATNLEESIRQAQMLRLAGQYPEAIKHLSQLMMLASDDGRVVSEYGKTLASMGRASDAVNFLTRAKELQPGDWTIYSAMGVAYDQIGDQKSAQAAYEQALKLKPEEPSVLSNFSLSRMLAKDPETARKLAVRAESANSTADPKIARNIAMIRSMAPEDVPVAANTAPNVPAASHVQATAATATQAKPQTGTQTAAQTATQTTTQATTQPTTQPTTQADNKVVMQRVPVDPLAGPVQKAATPAPATAAKAVPVTPSSPASTVTAKAAPAPAIQASAAPVKAAEVKPSLPVNATPVATGAPRSLQPAIMAQTPPAPLSVPGAANPFVAKPAAAVTAIPAITQPTTAKPVEAAKAAPAPVKPAETKPEPVKAADAAKPAAKAPVAAAAAPMKVTIPAPAKTADAEKPSASVSLTMTPAKPVDANRTASAPKVLPPGKPSDVKTAGTKPKAKEAIPGLRMSANAY